MDHIFGNVLEQVEDLTNLKKTSTPLTNSQAISNFMYFGHNFPHDFILKVWAILCIHNQILRIFLEKINKINF